MEEELFTSGRNIPNIDPSLQIWHWPISVYLFLGGLAAGLLFFCSPVHRAKKRWGSPGNCEVCSDYGTHCLGTWVDSPVL